MLEIQDPLAPSSQEFKTDASIYRQIISLSVPLMLAQFLNIMSEQINYFFVGNLDDVTSLAAVGLGNMTINVAAFATILGMNTALETRVA